MNSITLSVIGMSCQGCERTVENSIRKIEGIKTVKADHKSKSVNIDCEFGVPGEAILKEAVENVGFKFMGIKAK